MAHCPNISMWRVYTEAMAWNVGAVCVRVCVWGGGSKSSTKKLPKQLQNQIYSEPTNEYKFRFTILYCLV